LKGNLSIYSIKYFHRHGQHFKMFELEHPEISIPPEKHRIPEQRLQTAKRYLDLCIPGIPATDICTEEATSDDLDSQPRYKGARKWKELSRHEARCEDPEDDMSFWLHARWANHKNIGTRELSAENIHEVKEFAKTITRERFLYADGEWITYFNMGVLGQIRNRDLNTKSELDLEVNFRWKIRVHEKAS
jgi:hypothetical protein